MNVHTPQTGPAAIKPLISHGRTLTDIMSDEEQRAYLDRIDADKAIGVMRLAILKTYAPNVFDVECWTDNIRPYSAILALECAAKRLRTLHQIPSNAAPAAVDNALDLRDQAEKLVDMVREWGPPTVGTRPGRLSAFNLSREVAVMSVMGVLAGARDAT
jgi:hypothetical protein